MKFRDLRKALTEVLVALCFRMLVTPLTIFIRRDDKKWIVIGREHGKFLDNAKHFFCWLNARQPDGHTAIFISELANTVNTLSGHGAIALRYPGIKAFWALLRAGTIVIDSVDQIEHGRIAFFPGARIVQLWHGAPLKEIELPLHQRRLMRLTPLKRRLLQFHKVLTGRYARYDFVISTSAFFTDNAFLRCFNAKQTIVTGYPRNDAMLVADATENLLVRSNIDENAHTCMRERRINGGRIVLYAPTFRKDRHSPFDSGRIDLRRWSAFAEQHGLLIALKLHPLMVGRYSTSNLPSIIDISAESDAYPLLSEVDLLITDYSSIFFDYLLLDRPVLFYPYDRDYYVSEDRHLLFEYDSMTPGPKVTNFDALLSCIKDTLDSTEDKWSHQRRRVAKLAFDHRDEHASERIWNALRK